MDLIDKYLGEKSYEDKPYGSKKNIDAGKKKYKTQDPPHDKHGIKGELDNDKWNENPMYKKSARSAEKKNPGRALTED